MEVGRRHPHAYALMFSAPTGALLMTSVHGIIAMENNGHLTAEKWQTTGDELIRTLIDRIA